MNERKKSIKDKMLSAVLLDESLMEFGHYSAEECEDIETAILSENPVVHAVATIIERYKNGANENEIYKEVSDYLKKNL